LKNGVALAAQARAAKSSAIPKRARLEDALQGLCDITILMLSMNQLIMAK